MRKTIFINYNLPAETIIGKEVTNIETPIKILNGSNTSTEVTFALKNLNPKYLQKRALESLKLINVPTTRKANAVNLWVFVYSHLIYSSSGTT